MSEEIKQAVYYGKNNVREQLKQGNVSKIYIYKHLTLNELLDEIKESQVPYVFVERQFLERKANTKEHQGIIAEVTPTKYIDFHDLIKQAKTEESPCILLLDEVQDPNNLGAILRVADAFQITGIVIEKKRCVQLNQTVAKVSTGAISYVPVARVGNLKNAMKDLVKNGFWTVVLDMDGQEDVVDFDYKQALGIIIGGEDKGISRSIKQQSDFSIKIDMGGHVNSINVATATAILAQARYRKIK